MQQPGNVSDNIEPLSMSYLVELSVVAPLHQEQIQDDMKNFSEQLKPYPLCVLLHLKFIYLYLYRTVFAISRYT